MKIEFDNMEEFEKAMQDLSKYHNCEKCQGKIVGIQIDMFGNTYCGYCGQRVDYPKLSEKGTKQLLEKIKKLK